MGTPSPGRGLDPSSLAPTVKRASFSFVPLAILQRAELLALEQRQQRVLERVVPHLVERRMFGKTKLGTPQ